MRPAAHLIFHRDEYDGPMQVASRRSDPREKGANHFACAILLPRAVLTDLDYVRGLGVLARFAPTEALPPYTPRSGHSDIAAVANSHPTTRLKPTPTP